MGSEMCIRDRPQTNNRAELRAVIGVLGYRLWHNEGYSRLIVATDSSYVVEGASEWTKGWQVNGWRTAQGKPVRNRDLWELLLSELARWAREGLEVCFWLIPRAVKGEADRLAREGAMMDAVEGYTKISGVMC